MFIYEREIFLTLNNGKIVLYDSDGKVISDFSNQVVYSKEPATGSPADQHKQTLNQFYLSESKAKIFTVVKENLLTE